MGDEFMASMVKWPLGSLYILEAEYANHHYCGLLWAGDLSSRQLRVEYSCRSDFLGGGDCCFLRLEVVELSGSKTCTLSLEESA